MGVIEDLTTRVSALEKDRDEHRQVHVRIDRKLDRLTDDMAEVKHDVGELKQDMAEVKANTADLGEIRARVALIPDLQAGQIELREMVATLLARSEQRGGRA